MFNTRTTAGFRQRLGWEFTDEATAVVPAASADLWDLAVPIGKPQFVNGNGEFDQFYKYGGIDGTRAIITHRADGVNIAFIFNAQPPKNTTIGGKGASEWLLEQLGELANWVIYGP